MFLQINQDGGNLAAAPGRPAKTLANLVKSEISIEHLQNHQPKIIQLVKAAKDAIGREPERAAMMLRQASDLLGASDKPIQLLAVPQPQPLKGGLAPWQYRNAEVFIDTQLTSCIRLEALAAVTRLSVSHFSRAFKVSYGEAPYLYVTRKRVELAQMLMLTTEESLCQIAACCGLADQAHLSNLFRRYVGMTPFAWRRLNRVS